MDIKLADNGYKVIEAKVVTNTDIHVHNTFEAPEQITEQEFTGYTEHEDHIFVKLPAGSVTVLRVRK